MIPRMLAWSGGAFPAFAGNSHIGNRFPPTHDLSPSPSDLRTQTEEGLEGDSSLPTHPPLELNAVSFIICAVLQVHIFSPAPPPSPLRVHVSLFGFTNVNTQEPCLGGGGTLVYGEGPSRVPVRRTSRGPNVNTACDTRTHTRF